MSEPVYCRDCDETEVATEGARCPACVERRNGDAAIDATYRLDRLVEMKDALTEATEDHPMRCGCALCRVWPALYDAVRSAERPGYEGPGMLTAMEAQP